MTDSLFGSPLRRAVSHALLAVFLAAMAPTLGVAQQPTGGAIGELAREWSGNQAPTCRQQSTGGEMVDGQIDPWECEWRAAVGDQELGHIRGWLDERVSTIMWERPARDAADADSTMRSLEAAFTARGLKRHNCGDGEVPAGSVRTMLWAGPGLAIHISRITPPKDPPRFVISATNAPALLPQIMKCGVIR